MVAHTPTEVRLQWGPVLVDPGGDSQAFPLVSGLYSFVLPASVRVDGGDAVRLCEHTADLIPVVPEQRGPQPGKPVLHGQLVPDSTGPQFL